MKHFLVFFLLLPVYSFCQNITIFVSDFETKEPLPFANIYFKKSGVGISTNMEGYAYFKQPDLFQKDTIVISYIGYNEHVLSFSKENSQGLITVKLKPSNQFLSEMVLSYEKPLKPVKIIKKAIKNIADNYSTHPVIFNSLYRETVEENGNFIQLNEAFVNIYYSEYPQKKLDRKIWEDWYYDASYAFELEGDLSSRPLFNDFNTKEDKQILLASRHSDDLSHYGIETTLIGDPLPLFAFDKIKYQYDFFNPAILNKYKFKHKDTEIINGEECYVLSFYPKSAQRNFGLNLSKKNKFPIYMGRVYISKESFALVKFIYNLAVDRDFGFFETRIPLDYQVEMNYTKLNGIHHIQNIKRSETKKVGTKDNGESILHTSTKELYILHTETNEVNTFPDSLLFKSTQFSSIRCYKKNYNPDYWNTIELPDSLQLGDKLIADLEVNQPLVVQFDSYKKEQKKDLPTPSAFKKHFTHHYHNTSVIDSLHWMANPKYDRKLKNYLRDENKYAKNELIEDKVYQKKLFDQLNTFYPSETDSNRIHKTNTYFVDEDSLSNLVYYYQKDSMNRIEVINISSFENKYKNSHIQDVKVSKAKNLILVAYTTLGIIGEFTVTLPFGDDVVIDSISNISSIEWYTESTFIYTKTNNIGSSRKLIIRDINTKKDSILYLEKDPEFDVEVIKIDSHLFCTVQSKTENEIYLIKTGASFPQIELIKKRKKGVQVEVKSKDGIYLLVNDKTNGSSIEFCSFTNPESPKFLAKAYKSDYITDILPLKDIIMAIVYEHSIPKLKYYDQNKNKWHDIETKLGIGRYTFISSEDSGNSALFSFSSPSNPYSTYRYNFKTSKLSIVSETKSCESNYYQYVSTKRLWAKGFDGTKIPITFLKNRISMKGSTGLILKVYGAYGSLTTPYFDTEDAILLEQGYTIAYAHVRGESILGQSWYKSGRELAKENSIRDYIACAEYLIEEGYTTSKPLIGYGNSAGGLIVAQAINLKPKLFNTVILDHPYLDVVNTMMNDSLPLTKDEYKEWGNPQNKEVYNYIQRYSPYQNIKSQLYPNVLIIASYQDYQTPIWQIAKYTSKLRDHNLSKSKIIMLTDMNSGHMGNITGKEWIKLFARTYSFAKLKNIVIHK